MNTKKSVISLLLPSILLSVISMGISFADAPPESNFTPNRTGVNIDYDGAPGFEAATYNNFKYSLDVVDTEGNPIPGQSTPIDERKFLYAGIADNLLQIGIDDYCPEKDNIPGCIDFYNSYFDEVETGQVFEDGDLVIFRTFFHNNGEDPYDGSGENLVKGPADARNTYIGIDLSDPKHPVSFIQSESNRYYPVNNPSVNNYTVDYNSPLNFTAGDYYFDPTVKNGQFLPEGSGKIGTPATTASDDVTFEFDPNLKPVNLNLNAKDKLNADLAPLGKSIQDLGASVYIEYNINEDPKIETLVNEFVEKGENFTAQIPVVNMNFNGNGESPGTKPLEFTFDYDLAKKIAWIKIANHPSCFRYAGRIYFYALIEREEPEPPPQENIVKCESLTFTSNVNVCSEDPKYTNFTVGVKMDKDVKSGQYITFNPGYQGEVSPVLTITDPALQKNTFTEFPATVKLNGQDKISGTFYGLSNLYAYFADGTGESIEKIIIIGDQVSDIIKGKTACFGSLDVCDNTCDDICVDHPEQIPVGSYSEFSAVATGYNGNEWSNEILYKADSDNGEFFTDLDALKAAHPDAYENPFDQVDECGMGDISLFIKNIVASLPTPQRNPHSGFFASVLLADTLGPIKINTEINPIDASELGTYDTEYTDFGTIKLETEIDAIDAGSLGTLGDDIVGTDNPHLGDGQFNPGPAGGLYIKPDDLNPVVPGEPPCDEPAPENGIKVPQEQKVYFYAKKAGTNKISVYAECTDEPNCEQKFSIVGSPVCSSIDFAYTSTEGNQGACVKENVPTTIAASDLTMKIGDLTFKPQEGSPFYKWYSDPAEIGTFKDTAQTGNPLTTNENAVVYETDQNTTILGYLSSFAGINYIEDQLPDACTFILPACPEEPLICELLHYKVKSYLQDQSLGDETNVTSLPSEDIYIFESSLEYSVPEIQPNRVDYKTTSQYGVFALEQDFTIPIVELSLTIPEPIENWSTTKLAVPTDTKVLFYPMQNLNPGTHTNVITLTATASDPLTASGCTKYLSLIVPEKDKCQSITLHADPSWPPNTLPASTKLYITGTLGDYDGKFAFNLTAANGDTSYLSLDNEPDANGESKLEVSESKAFDGIYMFGPGLQTDWVVQVKASEEENTACVSQLTYVPEPVKPKEEKPKCEKLEIVKPGSPWYLDIEENEEDFEVKVTGTPINNTWTIDWDIPVNPEGIASFEHETSTSYTNILKNPYEGLTVFIKVKDADPGICEATISPEITEKISPSIKKRVRAGDFDDDPGDSKFSNDWDDLINISAKDIDEDGKEILPNDSKYVTYKIDFKPGEGHGVSSAVIKETEFNDGVLEGSKGGELVFQGNLWIEAYFKNDPDELYLNDDDNDLKICEYDGNSLETEKVCVTNPDKDADSLEDLADSFSDADEGLVFNNIENVQKIKIYYEMKNETALDQETCNKLDAEKDGCGEEFPNEVEFKAYKDNDLKGDKVDSDQDDALVVAICPFILTRAGGDVFFSSELTSGIDVAYCSEQKNIQGPIINPVKPKEEEKQEIPKTGLGDTTGKTYLTTPTHDICKYSNVEGATIGAFNNPLENFSSTICEMKAEVAKEWQQEYVVKQINKNISNLGRWHETLATNQFPPSTDTNIYSYTDKDITIPGLTISDPAAQTYIIKNGDLNITGNITYQTLDAFGPLNPKKVPSAAFVVIDGNINISPNVTQLDGVYIAIDTASTGKGKITSVGYSYTPLTFNGILIGNVSDLFSKRRYSGNVSMEQGSVTIKFSQNFLLNTPPGLSDLLDLTQLKVAF